MNHPLPHKFRLTWIPPFQSQFGSTHQGVRNFGTFSTLLVGAIISLGFITSAQAAVTLGVLTSAHNDSPNSFNWTITDFNNATPTVSTTTPSSEIPNTTPTIAGSLTDAGNFGGSESLVLNLYATNSWNSFVPDAATFDTQISNIRGDQDLRMFNSDISVINPTMIGTNVALILEINTDNVTGEVTLLDVGIGNGGGSDVANYIVWDSDTDTFLTNQTGRSTSRSYGPHILTTGDIVVLGVDDTNTGDFRFDNFQLDVAAVPEPSFSLLLGTGFLAFLRRRRSHGHAQEK